MGLNTPHHNFRSLISFMWIDVRTKVLHNAAIDKSQRIPETKLNNSTKMISVLSQGRILTLLFCIKIRNLFLDLLIFFLLHINWTISLHFVLIQHTCTLIIHVWMLLQVAELCINVRLPTLNYIIILILFEKPS